MERSVEVLLHLPRQRTHERVDVLEDKHALRKKKKAIRQDRSVSMNTSTETAVETDSGVTAR